MKKLIETIRERLKQATVAAFGAAFNDVEPAIVDATNPDFGDFQTNLAMTLSKRVGAPPRTIAEKIIAGANFDDVLEVPQIAGPGFINLRIKKDYLESELNKLRNDERLGVPKASTPHRVVIDMSSPNIAKEMHVGHLRSTVIGDCIARTYEFLGHDVLRLNHVGDWGTAFGMLIAEMKESYPSALSNQDALSLGELGSLYKQAKKHFDADPEFKNTARLEVVKLQAGDPESLKAWQLICDQSRRAFQFIYDLLDVTALVERGESFYNPYLADVVKELEQKELLVVDQGAKCVFVEGFLTAEGDPLPLLVQKEDGGYNYATTDLASIRHRIEKENADECIYVVDAGQSTHFQQFFEVARRAKWVPDTVRVQHVPFGLVLGEDGKKLKTRSGETVKLEDLLSEALTTARAELEERLKADGRTESEEFIADVSRTIGIGAVKYADLSLNRMTNYTFSFKRMLSLQGNTAPYMLNAYVRVQGISRKGEIDFDNLPDDARVILEEKAEMSLAKQILKLDEVLDSVIQEFQPNRIAEFLYELSQTFHKFYETCPVLKAEEPSRTSRLMLCHMTARTIALGLNLLGIRTIERM